MDFDGQTSCATADGVTQEVYALLAQANLCRIRGNWPDAIEKCMAAMRMDPQSVAAHGLLGDIYENKGCLDDAIQWYRMALDINPDSPADHQKLERLLIQKSRILDRTKPAAAPPSPVAAVAPPAEQKSGWVRDPFKTLRVTAFSSAALVLAIVIVAMLVSHSHGAGNAAQSQIATPPVVLTSDGLTPSNDDAHGGLSDVRETVDERLLTGMRGDSDLTGHDVSVTDVQSDPRSGRATVTILIAAKDSASLNRDTVAEAILRAAHSAMRLTDPASYTDFTVRVLIPSSSDASTASGAALAALADISRANQAVLDADIAQLTPAQRQQMLTHTWWAGSVLDTPIS